MTLAGKLLREKWKTMTAGEGDTNDPVWDTSSLPAKVFVFGKRIEGGLPHPSLPPTLGDDGGADVSLLTTDSVNNSVALVERTPSTTPPPLIIMVKSWSRGGSSAVVGQAGLTMAAVWGLAPGRKERRWVPLSGLHGEASGECEMTFELQVFKDAAPARSTGTAVRSRLRPTR